MILIEFVFIYEWRRQTIYNVSSPYTPIGLFFFFVSYILFICDFWLLTLVLPCRQIWYLCAGFIWPGIPWANTQKTCIFIKKLAYTKKNSQ